MQNGKFIPEKSNIWRDCVDGYFDWVKEHILEVMHSQLPVLGLTLCAIACKMSCLKKSEHISSTEVQWNASNRTDCNAPV